MKKEKFARWAWALRSPDTYGLPSILLFVTLAALALATYMRFPLVLLAFAAITGGLAVFLVRQGLQYYDVVGAKRARDVEMAAASLWARSAATAEEIRERDRLISEMGPGAALSSAGLTYDEVYRQAGWSSTPLANVNGAPFAPGFMADINGDAMGGSMWTPSADIGNDTALSPGYEYSSPVGMESSVFSDDR